MQKPTAKQIEEYKERHAERERQRILADKEQQAANIACCGIFGVPDISYISKNALIDAVVKLKTKNDYLSIELFCADCYHPYFKKATEENLAPLRNIRVARHAVGQAAG